MVEYHLHKVALSDTQKREIAKAAMNKSPITVSLKVSSLDGPDELYLTSMQKQKLDKRRAKGLGAKLNLSVAQLKYMKKQGGFIGAILPFLTSTVLPALATGAATSAGSMLFNKLFGKGGSGTGGMILPMEKPGKPVMFPIPYPVGAIAETPKLSFKKGGWVPGGTEPEHMMYPMGRPKKGGCAMCASGQGAKKKLRGDGLYLHGTAPRPRR